MDSSATLFSSYDSSLAPVTSISPINQITGQAGYAGVQYSSDALVIESTLVNGTGGDAADVDIHVDDIYKSLSITSQQILQKLNDILSGKLPKPLSEFTPEEITPEATSDSIFAGISASFEAYAKSNSDFEPEELISRFLKAAREGVQTGYDDATATLRDLGAFEIDGIEKGASETKRLLDEELNQFEVALRKRYGLSTQGGTDVQASTSSGILTQAAATIGQQARTLDLSA